MSSSSPAAIGLDVGGHGVRAVLVSQSGQILAEDEAWIDGVEGRSIEEVEAIVARLVSSLREAAGTERSEELPVGVGIPGFHDRKAGLLRASPNFPGWEDTPVEARLQALLKAPVRTENDANCALLGEAWCGAARACSDAILVTLGTGVGTGFLVGGRLVRGARGAGGEGGHVAIYPGGRRCGCGQRGCFESYVSSEGLVQTAREAWGEEGLREACPAQEAIDVFAAEAEAGGPEPTLWASRAIERWSLDLGLGLAPLVHIFSPQVIVLAGGISGAIERFRGSVEDCLRKKCIPACLGEALPLRAAELGDRAGAVGAAALWIQHSPSLPS